MTSGFQIRMKLSEKRIIHRRLGEFDLGKLNDLIIR